MNKTFVTIALVAIVVLSIVYLESIKPKTLGNSSAAPDLEGIAGYINTGSNITLAQLRGKVVLVDFWTYSCVNCIRTLPFLAAWDAKYRDNGLVIIGVHTPEFEFEKDISNVKMAVQKYGIKYPVVLDNDYATWNAFHNSYWPRKYLIDKQGVIRFDHIGEGGYAETESQIDELLGEKTTTVNIPDNTPTTDNSPETYLGYDNALSRGEDIGNGGFTKNMDHVYSFPATLSDDKVYLDGTWHSGAEYLVPSDGSKVRYRFHAKKVNLVMDGKGNVSVMIDGMAIKKGSYGSDVSDGYTAVNESRLYELYSDTYGTHTLDLRFSGKIHAYAFTFG